MSQLMCPFKHYNKTFHPCIADKCALYVTYGNRGGCALKYLGITSSNLTFLERISAQIDDLNANMKN